MILTAPTGSYLTVLPKGPLDPISIIYTISSGPPPRDTSSYQQIPEGIKDQKHSSRHFSDAIRRATVGDLVYTTKLSSPVKVNNGSKLFGYGQILEFVDETPVVVATAFSSSLTTKHNNSYVDLASLGLDDEEQHNLAEEAVITQRELLNKIGDLQKRQSSLAIDMIDLQGQINEATKVILGLETILSINGTGNDRIYIVYNKVKSKLTNLTEILTATTVAYNIIPDQISMIRDSLTALTTLVK